MYHNSYCDIFRKFFISGRFNDSKKAIVSKVLNFEVVNYSYNYVKNVLHYKKIILEWNSQLLCTIFFNNSFPSTSYNSPGVGLQKKKLFVISLLYSCEKNFFFFFFALQASWVRHAKLYLIFLHTFRGPFILFWNLFALPAGSYCIVN